MKKSNRYLIRRTDTKEYFHAQSSGPGFSAFAWTMQASLARLFYSEQAAIKYSTFIGKPTEIVCSQVD